MNYGFPPRPHPGLYDPAFEHDSCGVGFIADLHGRPSHGLLKLAVEAVCNVTHRGAVAADARTGDGAGLLTQIPRRLFRRELEKLGHPSVPDRDLAVGMLFLPPPTDEVAHALCVVLVEELIDRYGLSFFGWRTVPTDPSTLGHRALKTVPDIRQVLVGRPRGQSDEAFERTLYLTRREIENRVARRGIANFYVPSFSHRTLVYKALVVAPQLARFYRDLRDPDYETGLAVFHQRYSTNTFPTWFLAQPFRFLAHNGEINTLQGNRHGIRAREPELTSEVWGEDLRKLLPILQEGGSDSASLDNVCEVLRMSGRSLLHAMAMLIPEPYQRMAQMDPDLRAFYEYHAALMEPWDGPAAVAFTDGTVVGATLDRNGLRPARYKVTKDGLVVLGSEVGVVELDDREVVEKGRLGPGQMIAVDTLRGQLLRNDEIKMELACHQPYQHWVQHYMLWADAPDFSSETPATRLAGEPAVRQCQQIFHYTEDELDYVFQPMAREGKEPTGSMGDDTPLAVLSQRSQLLYHYFRQRFAQVTNPPIDPLRESLVMSLNTALGRRGSMLEETPKHARLIKFTSPILLDSEMKMLRLLHDPAFQSATLPALFPVAAGPEGWEQGCSPPRSGEGPGERLARGLEELCAAAERAVEAGATLLILSDRGVDADHAPIPMLLAVGAVHHTLILRGRRMQASIVAETGEARDVHHLAALIGYGAAAVNPYLVFEIIHHLIQQGELPGLDYRQALRNYRKVVDAGLAKIMSKMGISTLSSYRGSQIFEAIGLDEDLVERYFTGTASRLGGVGLAEIAADVLRGHAAAFGPKAGELVDGGIFRFRREGEYHAFNPGVFKALHQYARSGQYEDYRRFAAQVEGRPPLALRDLLTFREGEGRGGKGTAEETGKLGNWAAKQGKLENRETGQLGNQPQPPEPDFQISQLPSVPLEEVEPVESIVRRFATAAMSHGALSREAHETLAIAMNRLGAKSNSGEGGEDPRRYHHRPNGDWPNSAIKQVASARFGVTPEYLASARELEIKMAQGSKPGEGGQLPGHKVSVEIAQIRHASPGVTLISPPPHHDIYSIEDLSQLIYDLKHANPRARVAVKLVSEAGIGTIAAGVAKAYADVIHISGHDGGTGASPLSSIKHAGSPWELGLAEVQQTLVMNDLRGRVVLRVDGGMKTGRDVLIAALLGAEEFGFGSAAVVSAGCVMARQCHLNTCPVGVASQREDLRAKFPGKPEHVVNFFLGVAQQVRELLASLGFRRLDDVIGRADLLQVRDDLDHPKARRLDLSALLVAPEPGDTRPRRHVRERNDRPDAPLDDVILQDAIEAIGRNQSARLSYSIRNTHRAVGAKLAGEIAFHYGDQGLDGVIECTFRGSAGQSFGAFCIRGLRLILIGEANDYVGKGMHGGEIIVRPPEETGFVPHENILLGNTVMYGATGGELYAAGRAGERFAVRNSGGQAVVEGVGDHGCEYMTGGLVVILGPVGRNFGAGMTGGVAYVLDEAGDPSAALRTGLPQQYNPELIELQRVTDPADAEDLRRRIERHLHHTASARARGILERWEDVLPFFWKVVPR